jgi:photosystem II stability/assembly factor-like uncharacterized protein
MKGRETTTPTSNSASEKLRAEALLYFALICVHLCSSVAAFLPSEFMKLSIGQRLATVRKTRRNSPGKLYHFGGKAHKIQVSSQGTYCPNFDFVISA